MERIFYPKSIVVIGVSERPDNLARNIIANLRAFEYSGDLYAVGRREGEILGIKIVSSLDEVPDGLDLAVILTPATIVPSLMESCGRKSILRVIVESGGFSEFSDEGRQLEEQLLAIAHKWNMRLVGPNCISVVNLENGVCLPFAPIPPAIACLGPASVVSQSGGVSITYMGQLSLAGVGVNKVISIGNKADLDETDYLKYLLADDGTEMICLYLESLSDGQQLMELARVSSKPIIIHKANRGQASQAIAFSHTAALADDDRIVSAAFRQAGIIRAEGFRDLVTIAQGLSLPPVNGSDLMIISRSGGHAVAAADAAERLGFRLPPPPDSFIEAVRAHFRADVIAPTNPLDLGVVFDFDIYAFIVEQSLQVLSPDAILLINTYTQNEALGARRLASRVGEIVKQTDRPIAFCVYSDTDDIQEVQSEIGLPVFNDIEDALRGLAASRDWNQTRTIPIDPTPTSVRISPPMGVEFPLDEGTITSDIALTFCQTYGISVAPWEVAHDPDEAVLSAQRLGLPVALKILSSELVHKTDAGGVALGLDEPSAVKRTAETMLSQLVVHPSIEQPASLMVQQMVQNGIEVILGGKRDPTFGPVVMFGLGGILVEIFDDVAFRVAPLTRADALTMIDEVRGSRLLRGFRGEAAINQEALVQALLSLSQLLVENPRISEVDINPMILTEDRAIAVDARAVVTAP